MKKRCLPNTEIAKAVWETIEENDLYENIYDIVEAIDLGRTPEQEEEELYSEDEIKEIIQNCIYGFETEVQEYNFTEVEKEGLRVVAAEYERTRNSISGGGYHGRD